MFRIDPDSDRRPKGFWQAPAGTVPRLTRKAMNELKSQAFCDDDDLALTLMTMWALYTGRAMPGRPPRLLTEQELLDFWAE
jgi:hypothetical protein